MNQLPETSAPDAPGTFSAGTARIPFWRSAVLALVVGAVVAVCYFGPNPNTPTQAGVILKLPIWVGNYLGEDQDVTAAEKTILPDDTEFARAEYRSPRGDKINCQIVLSGGQKRSIHRPEICLPGQGWNVRGGRATPIEMPDGSTLRVMKLDLSRPITLSNGESTTLRSVFLYWFVGKDTTTPYHWERILQTSYDRVAHNLNHRWAYVVVSSPITKDFDPNGRDEEQTVEALKKFIREAAPQFMRQEQAAGHTAVR